MAVAFDAVGPGSTGKTTTGTNVATITWTHTPVGTPTAVLVCVTIDNPSGNTFTFTTATYGTSTLSLLGSTTVGATNIGDIYVFGATGIPSGAQTVTITWTGGSSVDVATGGSVTFTGSATTNAAAFGTFQHTNGNSSSFSFALSTTQTSSVAFGGLGYGGSTAPSGLSGGTSRYITASQNSNGSVGISAGGTATGTGGNITFTWMAGGPSTYAIVGVEVLPPAAGGSSQFPAGGPTIEPSPVWLNRFGSRKAPNGKLQVPIAPPTRFTDTDAVHGTDGGETVVVVPVAQFPAGGPTIEPSPVWLNRFGTRRQPLKLQTPIAPPARFASTDSSGPETDAGEAIVASLADTDSSGPETDAGEAIAATLADTDASGPETDAGEAIAATLTGTDASGPETDAGEAIAAALSDIDSSGPETDAGEAIAVALSDTDVSGPETDTARDPDQLGALNIIPAV